MQVSEPIEGQRHTLDKKIREQSKFICEQEDYLQDLKRMRDEELKENGKTHNWQEFVDEIDGLLDNLDDDYRQLGIDYAHRFRLG